MARSLTESYREFDRVVRDVERWLDEVFLPDGFYASSAIKRRLAQRFVELAMKPYLAHATSGVAEKAHTPAEKSSTLWMGGAGIARVDGSVRLRAKSLVWSLIEFFVCWALCGFASFVALFKIWHRRGAPPATLFHGVGVENYAGKQAERFAKFCEQGPIAPLREAARIILQSSDETRPSPSRVRIEYSRIPLLAALSGSGLGMRQILRFWRDHFYALYCYLRLAVRCRMGVTLGRDYGFAAAASVLNRAGLLQSVVLTSTNHSSQPLWMTDLPDRKFRTHMIRYSQNSVFPVMKNEPHPEPVPIPTYRHMKIDDMWLWTPGHADQMKSFGVSCTFHAVGPILWYLPEDVGFEMDGAPSICVFDVTPMSPEYARKLGYPNNYYSAENMIRFVSDIIAARDHAAKSIGKDIAIIFKHKRGYHASHDRRYIDFIQQTATSIPNFKLIDTDSNIYSIVKSAALTIVALYSSPAYVACHVGKPAIYYDPTGDVVPMFEKLPGLSFVAGGKALAAATADALTAFCELRKV